MKKKIECTQTKSGFKWGPLEVFRSVEDPDGEWVVIQCSSKMRNVEIYAQENGDMRVWIDGVELVVPRPVLGLGGFN